MSSKKVSIGLTQFTDFTFKGVTGKTSMVRQIKYQDEYNPAFDYWKTLRDGIRKFHEIEFSNDYLLSVANKVAQAKQKNYLEAVKAYLKFIKNKEIEWFDPGKSNWYSEYLTVRSSPELGLKIDGVPHLIKLYFKGKDERIDKNKCRSSLTLLKQSDFTIEHSPNIKPAILNVQKGRLISDEPSTEDHLIALESEAAQFMIIWNKI